MTNLETELAPSLTEKEQQDIFVRGVLSERLRISTDELKNWNAYRRIDIGIDDGQAIPGSETTMIMCSIVDPETNQERTEYINADDPDSPLVRHSELNNKLADIFRRIVDGSPFVRRPVKRKNEQKET